LELVTKTKSVVSVAQAVTSPAARRLAAAASRSWLDLFNFMRIFRQGAARSGPENSGLESNARRLHGETGPASGYVLEDSIGTFKSGPEASQPADIRPRKKNWIGSGAPAFPSPM
jgi:hypothetical protein